MKKRYFLEGLAAGRGKGSGNAVIVINSEVQIQPKGQDAYVVIADLTTPDLTPLLVDAQGIVTDIGGLSSHAANISRELGIPCVVSTQFGTKRINQGDFVEVDGDNGIVAYTIRTECVFCDKHPRSHVLETSNFFALYDGFPVREGHLLLIPKRHIETFMELTEEEFHDLFQILQQADRFLRLNHGAEGYNIGINNGIVAGQTISHLHIHVIPRKKGDVAEPKGGIRNFLPNPLTEYPVEILKQ